MPKYIPARDRMVRLDRRRGNALFEFVRKLADAGDMKAAAFLDALLAGAFDLRSDGLSGKMVWRSRGNSVKVIEFKGKSTILSLW
jgi:hypothetical protein